MRTLGMRMEQRDAALFCGREQELAQFDRLLVEPGGDEQRVVLLWGPGGIGKSTLAREMARRASLAEMSVHWIDGRELAPVPEALEGQLGDISEDERPFVVIDS
jgi:replication-associated recombination protein RarA